MGNKEFRCKHFNPDLNEELTISFYPNTNTDNANAEVVELAPEIFVLEELDLYSWNNDMILGLSNPMKCLINIKFDKLQEQLSIENQTDLFNAIVFPFRRVTIYQGDKNEYRTHLSNYIKIVSETFGTLRFMQDIYSNIDMGNILTSINLSCTDLISNILKQMSCEKTISYVMDNIETLGTKSIDYDYSKFAFDWINGKSEDEPLIYDLGYSLPNQFFKARTPWGAVISGQNKYDGASTKKNTKIVNNYRTNKSYFLYTETQFPVREMLTNNAGTGNDGRRFEYNYANNGLARLQFMNIQSFYNFITQEANKILGFYDNIQIDNFTLQFDYFYKQKYNGDITRGNLLDASNNWFLYRIRGCGTFEYTDDKNIQSKWSDTEYYLTNQDVAKQLNYSCVFDLLTDVLISTLNSYTQTENGFELYTEPSNEIKLDLKQSVIEKNISFNYKIVNIQTGKVDLQKDASTSTIITAPGTAQNINIPSFYNAYPIRPERAFNHSFIPIVRANINAVNGDAPPINGAVECIYATDIYKSEQIVNSWWTGLNNAYYENWGNCGFYYPENLSINENSDGRIPGIYNDKWIYDGDTISGGKVGDAITAWYNKMVGTQKHSETCVMFDIKYSNPKSLWSITKNNFMGPYPMSLNRRPVDMMHLNTSNFSTVKVWYREQYKNIEAGENDTAKLKAIYPDKYTFISAHHTGITDKYDIEGFELGFFTDFDWRHEIRTGANLSDGKMVCRYLGQPDAVMSNNVMTQTNTFDKLKEKYSNYTELAEITFNKLWYKLLKDRFEKEYISRIINIRIKPSEFNKVFQGKSLYELKNYIYDITFTDDEVRSILNTKYKVISIEYVEKNFVIKMSSIEM